MANTLKNNLDEATFKRGDCGSSTAFLLRAVAEAMPVGVLAIAVSGGLDSMALLHAAADMAREQQVRLLVFHIHHALQDVADDWVALVRETCSRLGIGFDMRYLNPQTRVSAQSIEDWARRERYAALAEMAQLHGASHIWLAQHQDDQIETHLLQKARGAGVRGLSAMPSRFEKYSVVWQRPWLNATRALITAYAAERGFVFAHDPSNDDVRFARNALRAKLRETPLSVESRLEILRDVADAQRQHRFESAWAVAELAALRVSHRSEIGELSRLRMPDASLYSPEQMALFVREWLAQLKLAMPSRAALNELIKQLTSVREDVRMCWRHSEGMGFAKFQGHWLAARLLPADQWFLTDELAQWVQLHDYELRARVGGERVRLHPKRPSQSLKNLYLMNGIPPMLRAQLPLIYHGERLVHVVGVGDVCE
jgi:tRNA(Ile)-lysidine synthase